MMLGGSPGPDVRTITCTSEMSGSASSGIWRMNQIPARTSRSVPAKTRNRFRAHQSIHREITSHTSRGVDVHLFVRDRLAVLLGEDRDLPRPAASEFPR